MACNTNVLLVEMLRNAKLIMATLWNRAGHYIFVLWFLLPSFFFLSLLGLFPWTQFCSDMICMQNISAKLQMRLLCH